MQWFKGTKFQDSSCEIEIQEQIQPTTQETYNQLISDDKYDGILLFDIFELDSYDKIRDFIIDNPTDARSKAIIEFMIKLGYIFMHFLIYGKCLCDDDKENSFQLEINYIVQQLKQRINKEHIEKIYPHSQIDKEKFLLFFDMFGVYSYREIINYLVYNSYSKRKSDIESLFESFNISKDEFSSRLFEFTKFKVVFR